MTDLILVPDNTELAEKGIATVGLEALRVPKNVGQRKPKFVSPELVAQAIANNPLETMPHWQFSDEVKASSTFRQALPQLRNSFLNTHFLLLADNGITFETPATEMSQKLSQLKQGKAHLSKHIEAVETCFRAFQKIFSFTDFIVEKGRFEEKHLTSLHSMCTAFAALNDPIRAARLMKPIGLQVEFNRERYIFELPTVFSTSNLPEILLAMPVCFLDVNSTVNEADPHPSAHLKMLCDIVSSKNFTWFYQMYNRRDRSIKDFKGADPIPSDYLEFRTGLKPLIDLEVICTPYHSIASKEWADPAWLAGIDPVALGLYSNLPFFTMFKRWSGNGIFPLLPDLMGDTISHMASNISKLDNFRHDSYWYKGNNLENNLLSGRLPQFAQEIIDAFKEGKVFQFLRG